MTKDLTRGSPWKLILQFALPIMAGNLLQQLYNTADTIIVGNFNGQQALSAVGACASLTALFTALAIGFSIGAGVLISQYFGASREQELRQYAATAIVLMLAMGLFMSIIGVVSARFLLERALGTPEALLPLTLLYFRIYAAGLVFQFGYNIAAALLRALGDSKATLYFLLVSSVLNVALDLAFVAGLGMGVAGAAVSTLLSRMVSAMVILRLIYNQNLAIHLEPVYDRRTYFRLDFEMVRRIFRIGVPNGLENSLFQVGKVLIMGIITTFSTPLRAANGIVGSISSIVNIPGSAIGLASIAVIGQLIGAGEKEEARRYGKKLLGLMYVAVFPLNLALLFVAEPVVRLFKLSEAGIPAAVQIARLYAFLSIFTWAPSFGLPNILRAAGDARYTMVVSVVSMLTLRLGASYLLVYGMGLSLLGVWIAMHMDWVARGVCFVARFMGRKWLEKKVI